ncbi:YbaB/EbfC family nucleoid-associated protein [Sphingomonas sp. IBVSS1]|jgi:DNA-binding YbaB/EbfC family protein|uniref:Nucleoid-associated protein CHU93_15170 n=1 Tax=Sandarakinorhabdus cyanobacteriorum TaxID=1981098 RepID=A0A255Y8D6_9SPHN|nr:YbaB/EbfC family nucleoid-associated protein [Sandarakinorhabdus cyanobacteriorum]OSZ69252.1 YbaB/EbfC family nucleoid-associated protein [Sphingomonas sp. IBVSS1]OYQ24700.1 YbaB/EbfC family nucleoid-associated protein [Sandarakinorhabdus cyanobacteriorum]
MPSLDELMNAARNVQQQMARAQAELDNILVEGASGGGLVKVRATARGAVRGVEIDPSLLTADSKEMLEDLVVAAFNDAKNKADQAGSAEMSKLTAGMQLPPGFKLPEF